MADVIADDTAFIQAGGSLPNIDSQLHPFYEVYKEF